MNNKEIRKPSALTSVGARRPYKQPALVAYGSVGQLTQSGSGMMDEMVMMNGTCQPAVMRNMC